MIARHLVEIESAFGFDVIQFSRGIGVRLIACPVTYSRANSRGVYEFLG